MGKYVHIRKKMICIITISIVTFATLTLLLLHFSYFGYIKDASKAELQKDFDTIETILSKEQKDYTRTILDWSIWDETYQFIENKNLSYINSNLTSEVLNSLNLQLMLFLNTDAEIIYEINENISEETRMLLFDKLIKTTSIQTNLPIILQDSFHSGTLLINQIPYFVFSAPIQASIENPKHNGYLIFVKEFDQELFDLLYKLENVSIKFSLDRHSGNDQMGSIQYMKQKKLWTASKSMTDIIGEPYVLTIEEYIPYSNSHYIVFILFFALLLVFLLFIILLFMDKQVIRRITRLSDFLKYVTSTGDTYQIITDDGTDDLSQLIGNVNQMLKRLQDLRSTDKLTKLKNRTFMEEELNRLDEDHQSQYFIVMVDIDGLKQTNDTMGHLHGDQILKLVSSILLKNCEHKGICARWGNDEFLILLKDTRERDMIDILQKIQNNLQSVTAAISISFGYAEKIAYSKFVEHPIITAENMMHHHKLMKKKSLRYSNVRSLLQVISENNQEVAVHTERMKTMCFHIGKILLLNQEQQNKLELLACMHDIGKIGIPERILMKPDKLTQSEFEIMKTHTEIGYRIAKSTPDLSYIADEILYHHEKYNGSGYPIGLKGEEIPLLSRIINVVDSFDVMTHERIYKKAMDTESAIAELKRCSGAQFDPFIVNIFIEYLSNNSSYIKNLDR